jgi:S1-C subfamily serine protease
MRLPWLMVMGWVGILSISTQTPVVESHQPAGEQSISLDIWDKVILVNCGGTFGEHGTGVIMDWGWIVTAKHVVKDCPVGSKTMVRWIKKDGGDNRIVKEREVKVLAKSDNTDLALLSNVDITGFPVGQYEAGNATIYGYPATVQSKIPVLIKPDNNRIKLTQQDLSKIKIRPGLSGGVVVQNQKLIGIVVTAWLNDQGEVSGTGFAVQSSDIDNFIQEYKKEKGL